MKKAHIYIILFLVSFAGYSQSKHTVVKGETLYSISKKYPGVTISDLKKWNNIKDDELKPGMKLKING